MTVTAKLKRAPISAQKCRLVVDMIRNMQVSDAVNTLKFTTKKGAQIVLKLLHSVIANAENNHGIDIDNLRVSTIYVNEAPSLKRIRARAKGRANRITKRMSHIVIEVSDGV